MEDKRGTRMKYMVTRLPVRRGATALPLIVLLAACGGGGGNSNPASGAAGEGSATTGSSAPSSAASATIAATTMSTPQYAPGSVELTMFNTLNQARQACGFPALQDNTLLDKAAAAHARYMGLNNAGGDDEVSGNTGFTGVTYQDRAVAAGFPSGAGGAGVSAADYSVPALTDTQYGQNLINEWLAGAYHGPAVLTPSGVIGVGTYQTTYNGYPEVWASMSLLNTTVGQTSSNAPLTYPCQGTTGVLYSIVGEQPAPPNTTGSFGTPIAVVGNPTDTVALSAGTLTAPGGAVIDLQLLDSTSDPNRILQPYTASAYPVTPLTANTTYTVSITGTDNGVPFSRSFSFTTAASE